MFNYVRQNTPADSVIIFEKPRALGLLAQRKSSIWPVTNDPERIWSYLRQIGATYAVLAKEVVPSAQPPALLPDNIEVADIRIVFENSDYLVYEIRSFH